jgi:cysteinyl-tRNA synthetase
MTPPQNPLPSPQSVPCPAAAPTGLAPPALSVPFSLAMAERKAPPQLELFNSMSKKKEPFQPRVEGKVSMYVCGVTPYDFSHIGHARAYVAFDVLYR